MKQFYILAAILGFTISANAQVEGASKIYGYKQEVQAGTVRVDENGKQVRSNPNYNYFIYLASSSKVTPTEVWINGKAYSVTSTLETSPVEHDANAVKKSKILVPKTTRRVLQISPTENELSKPNAKGKTLARKNELVIMYKAGGKTYYKTLSKFTMLEPLAME